MACGAEEPERDTRAVSELTPELEPVVAGNNAFAWSLYQAAAGADGNLFFSPFSISAAFGMTSVGAAGETAAEMKTVLKIADESYHAPFGALMRDLGGEHTGRGYQLFVANRLFGQAGLPFEQDFRTVTSQAYGAPLAEVDYRTNTEAARATINRWVSDRTRSRIPELIDAGKLTGQTVMVLANAIYFEADWAEQFDATQTKPGPFELASGAVVEVPMMRKTGKFRRIDRQGVSLLEMDYKDRELSMVVVLPSTLDGLPALEASLTIESLNSLIADASAGVFPVVLPRFELELELPLEDLIQNLGMKRAFDPAQADFSKLLATSFGLYLDFAVHKAFLKVDEQGSEAAAATAVGTVAKSHGPIPFVVDRPFIYLIRDRLTGSILFMGRLVNPAQN